MPTPPPVLVILDLSALMGKTSREWQDFSRIGACYVPQAVYEEIEFLTDRAPEPQWEKIAREFMRFFPNSGWQLTDAHATHPAFTPPGGANLSKQARLVVAVAQCTYGFAQENSDNLVVFVSNTQPILQRIPSLGTANLCGITVAALLQWVRTGEKPPAVTQQLQVFGAAGSQGGNNRSPAASPTQSSAPANSAPTMTGPASADRSSSQSKKRSSGTGLLTRLVSGAITFVVLAALGLVGWRFIQPTSFNQFWQKMNLPALPGQPPTQSPKPVKK
ncbi:PIN domain-containing protein [Aerosakkonema funiforme]|uniref:PIN domain-containing protein n=1 Tax=Aerosakkonema funiforme FACHB-1375 TaxID=2949571 RepID=A0A926VDP0_9CYAN|nr:PIN domain-containing protein [Aerosakkonema funiforme]MBD2180644.1 hypothetical protein [Aerosakkonema funiforme FACHB-1375]